MSMKPARTVVHDVLDRARGSKGGGFTVIELIVVASILSLLAIALIPACASNRTDSRAFQCLNNHRQLAAGWTTYASENKDRLPVSRPVAGDVRYTSPDSINAAWLTTYQSGSTVVSWMARYMPNADIWKCPSDIVPGSYGPRVRSVSLNGALNGSIVNVAFPSWPIDRQYLGVVREVYQLRKPAEVFLSMDEHPDSLNDSVFMFDPGRLPNLYQWRDLPASYHNGGAVYSSADGRAAVHRWIDDATKQPVTRQYKPWGSILPSPNSMDCQWMNDRMPYQEL